MVRFKITQREYELDKWIDNDDDENDEIMFGD